MTVQVFDASNTLVGTFATIQEAVDAAGNGYRLSVGAGTYVEQVVVDGIDDLTIEAAPGASVTIEAPATLAVTGAHSATAGGLNVYAVLTALDSLNLTISGIDINGAGAAGSIPNTNDDFVGVFFRNSSGELTDVDITGIHDPYPGGTTVDGFPVNAPYQRGSGVSVDNDSLLSFAMHGGSISDFQKNGGRFWQADLDISGVTVTGGGAQTGPAQNGFVVDSGTGSISGNTLTDIGYAGPVVAYSVMIYIRGADDLNVTNNILTGTNEATTDAKVLGIVYYDDNAANNGGIVTGNTISWVDTGIDVEDSLGAPGIVINGNNVANIDFTDAFSPAGVYFAPTDSLTLSFDVTGSNVHDYLAGAASGDMLSGLDGDDEFVGNGDNDILDGGGGTDTAYYAGDIADYSFTYQLDSGGNVISFTGVTDNVTGNGDEGADTLSSVEIVKFNDITLDVTQPVQLYDGATLVGTFDTIQEAVDAAGNGNRISVASGTYVEQVVVDGIDDLTIEAAPGATVVIQAPSSLAVTGQHAAAHNGGNDVYGILTVIDSLNVTIDGIGIDGAGEGDSVPTTGPNFAGVFFRNSSGELIDVDVTGVRSPYLDADTTLDGFPNLQPLQAGTGIVVDNDSLLAFTMTGGSISDFQKNAGRFWEADLDISGVTVTGSGAQTTGPAQNGFVVDSGTGSISGNTLTAIGYAGPVVAYSVIIYARGVDGLDVTGNIITGTNGATTAAQVLGIAYYDINAANNGGSITGNTISWVDTGVDVEGELGAPAIVVTGNIVTNIDITDTFFPSGVYFEPTDDIILNFAITGSGVHDTLIGAAGNDSFTALGGDDYLEGLDGNDTLNGGAGLDTMIGGLGNDTFFVDNVGDITEEATGEGFDSVYTSISYTLAAGTEVEWLSTNDVAAAIAINLTGNELDQYLVGNAGANILNGGGGADVLIGLGGNDTYVIATPGAAVLENAGGGFDSVYVDFNYALGTGVEVEWLSAIDNAATTAINLTGNEFVNYVVGNAGSNTLSGGGGADFLYGLGGNDNYIVDNVGDLVTEAAAGGFDAVYATVSYTLGAGQEIEFLSAIDQSATTAINLTGNELGQFLFGNNGDNVLNGGGGADTMVGFGGNDTYYVDNFNDVVTEGAGGGNDIVFASVSFILAGNAEVEVLQTDNIAGTAAINLHGSDSANSIYGNAGSNVLDGGLGADLLLGFGGVDYFAFTTTLGAGNVDLIGDFVAGTDKIALDDAIFTAAGPLGALNANAFVTGAAAADASDRIIYNNLTGQLFYDADGNGAGAAVQFATVTPGLGLTASDFLVF